jgi:hypothetical protein
VVPIAKHIPIRGPEEIKLFLDEYIEIPFEVENNFDCALGDVK